MKRNEPLARGTSLLIVVALAMGVTSCGTLLYPERRGQSEGQIDAGVAVLDGIGLLFFLIPGVIAFAVDFSTGAIYLPSGSSRLEIHPSELQDAQLVQTQPGSLTRHALEAVVEEESGQEIDLASPRTRVARVPAGGDLAWRAAAEVLTPTQLAAFESERPGAAMGAAQ